LSGRPDWGQSDAWSGMKGFEVGDGELGLLLDLDEGTLTVYKDGCRLGVMMGGLTGGILLDCNDPSSCECQSSSTECTH